jgi:putative hydrolase of the HAD superfamily
MDSRPKAIFFDVGWTLVHPRESLWDIFAALAREVGAPMDARQAEELVYSLMSANRENAVAEFESGASYSDSDAEFALLFTTMARAIFTIAGFPGDHDALALRFMERFWTRDNWVVYPEVVEAIGELRGHGVRVGILSNAGSDLLDFLGLLDLLRHVDFTVVSAIEGMKKPDSRIFTRALERAGVAPEHAVHVGDMYLEDILGARRVGVRPLLMERGALAMFPNHPESANHSPPSFDVVRDVHEVLKAAGLAR